MEQTMEIPTAGPETYCRLCLGTDNLRQVFHPGQNCPPDGFGEKNGVDPMSQGDELLEKIYECTNIKLSPSGDADCAICRRCLLAVEDFYHFRVRSKRVNDLIQVSTVAPGGPTTGTVSSSTVANGNASPKLKISVNLVKRRNPAKTVDGIRPHRCRYCPKSFRTVAALTEHGNRAHVSNRQHHCPNCLAQFQHAPSLARHMRSRACFAFSKYRCRVCSESFPDRDQWVDHIRVHAKDFPFQCPDCWSQFKHKATLRRHANTVHLLVQC
ncbi:AGAP003942-PA-like protein [Anopheles sinensis]|uniref:AGAP003942-PA-like protein n=1 Tax=Anopheles sinensis TaxID=74873 RepID=A0A084WQV8_ANOSI|nr:AGAP003942-PA-like protein [Anopheles sinensis]